MKISEIITNLKTQDNRSTAHPIFCVQIRMGHESWETVQCCFTKAGAEEHLAINGHNYKHSRIYVDSLHRNPEMIAIREMLLAMQEAK